MTTPRPPASPCIGICALDERDICVGCLRSGDEISAWGSMTAEEKARVYANVARREADSSYTVDVNAG